jgi:hypothetical protein
MVVGCVTGAADADTGTRVEVVALGFLVGEFGPDDAVGHVDGSDWICLRWWWIVGLWGAWRFSGSHFECRWAVSREIWEVSRVKIEEGGEERKRAIYNHRARITMVGHHKLPANNVDKDKPACSV